MPRREQQHPRVQKRKKRRPFVWTRRFLFEPLEDRRLLAADFLYQATDATALLLQASGGQLQIVEQEDPQVVLFSRAISATTEVLIQASDFDVHLAIDGSVPGFAGGITFAAGSGKTALTAPDGSNVWTVTGPGTGSLNGIVQFSGVDTLIGGSGNDVYQLLTNNNLGSLTIDESAGGVDSLDFSTATQDLTVDLSKPDEQTVSGNLKLTLGGNETLEIVHGGAGNDTLTGNSHDNTIVGGAGNDTLVGKTGDDRYVFSANWGNDTITEQPGANTGEGSDILDLSAVSANLTVVMKDVGDFALSGNGSITAKGMENIVLGPGANTLDYATYGSGVSVDLTLGQATGFESIAGVQHVLGSPFADILRGDARANTLRGSDGDDQIRGEAGADLIDGGAGTDNLSEVQDLNFTLTNTTLTATGAGIVGSEIDTLAGIEQVSLTGGASSNTIDASAFSGSVALDGGSVIDLALLNGGVGVRATDQETLSLIGHESTTLLSSLNSGDGIPSVPGNDFRIVLTDGQTIDVDISGAVTLQNLLDRIAQAGNTQASGRLSVALDEGSGDAIVLRDSLEAGEDLRVEPLNDSLAAEMLGLTVGGVKGVLYSAPISVVLADVRIRLTSGAEIDLDLSYLDNVQEVINRFYDADPRLILSINADGTGFVLTDVAGGSNTLAITALNGSLAGADLGLLGTSAGAVLLGQPIVTGNLRLDGRLDNDQLIGTAYDDTIVGSGGNDTIVGGGGSDTLVVARDSNITLTNTALTIDGTQVSTLSGIERAVLTGGLRNNVLDASAFTLGSVTLDGGEGNDTLRGGTQNDTLTGGRGIDVIDGGPGIDTILEYGDARFVLTNSSLDMAEGASEMVSVSLTGAVTGGSFTLTYDGETTEPIAWDAPAYEVASRLTALSNVADSEITAYKSTETSPWIVIFSGNASGREQVDLTAASIDLAGGSVSATVIQQGATALNSLSSIELAHLQGGLQANRMDASQFTGSVTLNGGYGDDILIGGPNNDTLDGSDGDDQITGGPGNDTIQGGSGLNRLIESRDVNFVLTDTTLTVTGASIVGTEVDTLSGFQEAWLTGGASANTLNAQSFTGISADTELRRLAGGEGVGTTSGVLVNLLGVEATTPLSLLNNGAGVRTVAGNDLRITLTNGVQIDVDLDSGMTLQAAFDAMQQAAAAVAPNRLTVSLDSTGTAIVLTDSQASGGNLRVDPLNGSLAAVDLGIQRAGTGQTLTGTVISDGRSDIQITLTNGSSVNVDLSGLSLLSDVLSAIEDAGPLLDAQLVGSSIVISDTAGGAGQLQVREFNGGTAAADLGILGSAPVGNRAMLTGTALGISSVVLNGQAGNDTLIGSPGNDTLTGGLGIDVIQGGPGIDVLLEVRDANFTLTNTSLVIGSDGADSLSGIETADLSGGARVNTLDASAWTLGPVTLRTGGGLDVLKGTGGDDEFIVDVANLTLPSDPPLPAERVQINGGGGGSDNIVYRNAPRTVTPQAYQFAMVSNPGSVTTYTMQAAELDLGQDLSMPGLNVVFEADRIHVHDAVIDVSDHRSGTFAGSIVMKGHHILVDGGAQLLAEGNVGTSRNGQISLLAVDDRAAVQALGFANVDLMDTDVTIGNATIRGHHVEVRATVDTRRLLQPSDFAPNPISQFLGGTVLSGIASALEGISAAVGVNVTRARAHVNIGVDPVFPATIIASSFTATTSTTTLSLSQPISVVFGAAVTVALTESETTIDNAHITTVSDALIRATSDHTVDVLADAAGPAAIGIAVSVVVANTQAVVTEDAQLTVGRDLYVQAENIDRSRTGAQGTTGAEGLLGVTIAVSAVSGDVAAVLDGQANVTRNINITSKQSKLPVLANKAFVLPSFVGGVSASSNVGTNSTGDLLDNAKASASSIVAGLLLDGTSHNNNSISRLKGGVRGAIKNSEKIAGYNGWFFSKVKGFANPPSEVERPAVQIAASVAVAVEVLNVTSQIGSSAGTSQTIVSAGGFISVTAKDEYRPDIAATSRAVGDEQDDLLSSDGLAKVKGQTTVGVAVSVAVGSYKHQTEAEIGNTAIVDAGGAIHVKAETLNRIDPLTLVGANLVAPFLNQNTKPDFRTEGGTRVLHAGDVVGLAAEYQHGGVAGTTYRYLGPDGAETDLDAEDYSNTTRWEPINLASNAGLNFFRTLTTYFGNNFSLDSALADSWSQATATGQEKASIAASVTVLNLDQSAHATIRSGARINQNTAMRNPGQTVDVLAINRNDAVNLGGNIQIPNYADLIGSSTNYRTWVVTPGSLARGANPVGTGGSDTDGAVGATAMVFRYQNEALATIEDDVTLTANSLQVAADNQVLGVAVGASGGRSEKFGFNGVVLVQEVSNRTIAQIGSTATIVVASGSVVDIDGHHTGSSLVVTANDQTNLVTVAGSLAVSKQVGIGASVGVNKVQRQTEAILGDRADQSSLATNGSITVAGKAQVSAENDGFIGSFAVAGAVSVGTSKPQLKGSGAAAMALGLNIVEDSSQAYIHNATVTATNDISLQALASPTVEAFSIGGAIGTGKATAVSIAGAVSWNKVDADVESFITDSGDGRHVQSTGGDVSLVANDDSTIASQAGAVSIAWVTTNQSTAVSVGISVASNDVGLQNGGGVRTFIENSEVTAAGNVTLQSKDASTIMGLSITGGGSGSAGFALGSTSVAVGGAITIGAATSKVEAIIVDGSKVTAGGNVLLEAMNETRVVTIAGVAEAAGSTGGSGGAKALAIGASQTVNILDNTVRAAIDGSTIQAGSSVTETAELKTGVTLIAFGLAGGGSASTSASLTAVGAGSGAVNVMTGAVHADITDSEVTAAGATQLLATDRSKTFVLAGSAAGGGSQGAKAATAVAVGASLIVNEIDNEITANVANTQLTATNFSSQAASQFTLTAAAVGFAGSGAAGGKGGIAVAAAGAGVVNSVSNRILAEVVGGSVATTVADAVLAAIDNTQIVTVAGAAAGSGSGGGDGVAISAQLGASFVINNVENTIAARIRDGATMISQGNVTLHAAENVQLTNVAIGFAGGGSGSSKVAIQIAGAGSGAGSEISSIVDASVVTSTVTAGGDLNATAEDRSQILTVAGAVAAGGAGGKEVGVAGAIGVSAADVAIGNTVRAVIDGGTVNAAQGVVLDAGSNAVIRTVTVGGVLAIGVGQNAGVGIAAGGAGSGNRIHNTIEAAVKGNSQITSAGGGLTITASDDSHITAVSVGAALAISSGQASVAVPIGAAVAVNHIGNTIHAGIENSHIVSVAAPIAVRATDNADIDTVAVAATLSVAVGQGGSVGVSGGGAGAENIILTTTTATIDGSTIDAAPSIDVAANTNASVHSLITSVAGAFVTGSNAGVGVAIGVGAARNFIGYDDLDNVRADYTSEQRPTSLTYGTTVRVEDGPLKGDVFRYVGQNVTDGAGIDLTYADYGDTRLWQQANIAEVPSGATALVRDSEIHTPGTLSVDAQSHADIDSTVVSVAIAISRSQAAVDVGVGGAFAINKIKNNVTAKIDGAADTDMLAGSVIVTASDESRIHADTAGAAVSAAFGQGVGVAVAFGLAIASNEISNAITATIVEADSLAATSGRIDVGSHSHNTIDSLSLAIALAPGLGSGGVGVGVAGGGAVSINQDLTQTRASIVNSDVTSAGNVAVSALNESDIDATVVMTSLAVGIGNGAGVGVSIGAAVARNLIGYTASGTRVGAPVQAYVENSSIQAGGQLGLTAESRASIHSEVGAGSAAIAGSVAGTAGVSGSGAGSENRVAYDTQAFVAGDSTGISVGSLSIAASDTSVIDAETGSVAFAANFSIGGASVSVGVSYAENLIDNRVYAYIAHADALETTSGDIALSATESEIIRANTFSAAGTLAVSLGAAVSSASTDASNTISSIVSTWIDSSEVTSAGNLSLTADEQSDVDAKIQAVAVGVGLAGVALGITLADNTVGGSVTAFVAHSSATAEGSGDITVAASSHPSVETSNTVGAAAVLIGIASSGGRANSTINTITGAYIDTADLTAVGDEIRIEAQATNSLAPRALSFAGSAVAIAALNADAVIAGRTVSYINGVSRVNAGTLLVSAESENTATPNTQIDGVSLLASITAAAADTNITRATDSVLATNSQLDIGSTNVTFHADSVSNADVSAKSVTASLISIGVIDLDTNVTPGTRATLEAGSTLRAAGGAVNLSASDTSQGHTRLQSVGVGLVLNVNVSNPASTVAPVTKAEVLGDIVGTSPSTRAGSVHVSATSSDVAETIFYGNNGGIINVSAGTARAISHPTTTAGVGAGSTILASGDVSILSQAKSEADASSRGSAGGVLTINALSAYAESTPVVTSDVGALATINAGGTITLGATAFPGRDSSPRTSAESGDGYTTAASATSAGGFLTIQDADSTTNVSSVVQNHLGASVQLSAHRILLTASGDTGAEVLTVGAGGGFISAGGVQAVLTDNNTVRNSLDAGVSLTASDSITLLANAVIYDHGDSSADIGGFVSFVSADTTVRTNYDVGNLIGASSRLTAGGTINVDANAALLAYGRSDAESGGLGANARSSNSDGEVDSAENKGVQITGSSRTDIFDNAHLKADSIRLAGRVSSLTAHMETRAKGKGLGTDADTVANVDISDRALVNIRSGAIVEAAGDLNLIADHAQTQATSRSLAIGASLGGDSDSTSIVDLDSISEVATQPGSRVLAHNLNVEATYFVNYYDRQADKSGAIDFGSTRARGDYNPQQIVTWLGDAEINGRYRDQRVEFDAAGNVVSMTGNLTIGGAAGITRPIDGLGWNSENVGTARIHANPISGFDGQTAPGSRLVTRESLFSNAPTFTFNDTVRSIEVISPGGQSLGFSPIDVVNQAGTPSITLDINEFSPPLGVIFHVERAYEPTTINIETGGSMYFNGKVGVNNPVGSTKITAASLSFDTLRSNELEIHTGGNIGAVITEFPGGKPVSRLPGIELTQISTGYPTLTLDAGGVITAAITGVQRVNRPYDPQFVAYIEELTANRLNVEFHPARQEFAFGNVGPVTITKTLPGTGSFPIGPFTKAVHQVFDIGFFGSTGDQDVYDTNVFGRPNGFQSSATYQVAGTFDIQNLETSTIDVKPNAILDYLHYEEAASLPTNFTPGAVQRWADLDGDGALDLLTSSGTSLTVLTNDLANNNTFRIAQTIDDGNSIYGFALGDADQDGDLDLAVQRGHFLHVLINAGGTFTSNEIPLVNPGFFGNATGGLAFADLDGNGYPDIIATGDYGLVIYPMTASGNAESHRPLLGHYSKLDVGDYDRDGDIDLLIGGNGQASRILRNDGGFSFTDVGLYFPATFDGPLQFGDSDGDGDLDVLVLGVPSNNERTLSIYENTGDGFLVRYSETDAFTNVLWNDHDGDGDLDVLLHYSLTFEGFFLGEGNIYGINVGTPGDSSSPLFAFTDSDNLVQSATLTGWSAANLVNGHGIDVLYTGQKDGQPIYRIFENLQPMTDSLPQVPVGLGANTLTSFATVSWSSPPGSVTATSPYTYNLRVRHGSQTFEIATPSGRGAISGTQFDLTDIVPGDIYQFSVQAVDASGRRSAWSSESTFVSSSFIFVNVAGDIDDGDPGNNQTTLREAINLANAEPGNYQILVGVLSIQLQSVLNLTSSVSIAGPIASKTEITGSGSDRLFNIDDGNLSTTIDVKLENLMLKGGRATNGGALYSTENLTLNEIHFADNVATGDGGGAFLNVPSNARVSIGTLRSEPFFGTNHADHNGGLIAITNAGTVSINSGVQLNGTSAGNDGGAFFIENQAAAQLQINAHLRQSSAGNAGAALALINAGFADVAVSSTEGTAKEGAGIWIHNTGPGATTTLSGRLNLGTAEIGGGAYVSNDGGLVSTRNLAIDMNTANSGGGLFLTQTTGTTTLNGIYVERNNALVSQGGALDLQNYSGTLTVSSSLFRENVAADSGSAIAFVSDGSEARTNISGNTLVSNQTGSDGAVFGFVQGGVANITQNTFSANALTNAGATGGSALTLEAAPGTQTFVTANTVAYNDSSIATGGSAVVLTATGDGARTFRSINNLFAGNVLANGAAAYSVGSANPSTELFQLIESANWIGDNAGLLPLTLSVGGLVPVHPLAANSPVVNQGADASLLPQFDQRGGGFDRAVGRPDVGAFERQAAGSYTFVVSTLDNRPDGNTSEGNFSLVEAIRRANASDGPDTITFAPSLFGGTISEAHFSSLVYLFQDSTAYVVDDLSIIGPGADLLTLRFPKFVVDDGNPSNQINFSLSGLRLIDQYVPQEFAENSTLSSVVFDRTFASGSSELVVRPETGATFRISDSFLNQTYFDVYGPGDAEIVNTTVVANESFFSLTGNSLPAAPSVTARDGSHLTVSNSTLVGNVPPMPGSQPEIAPTVGGIDGAATVISSIVPFVGPGSTIIHSLIGDGDPAGLTATTSTGTITIDATAPDAPVLSAPSGLIDTATPTISGTAEAGTTINVVVDPDDDASTRNSFTLITTVDGSGDWTIEVPAEHALLSGQRASFTVTATDAAQNVSSEATGSIEIDTTAPTAPVIAFPTFANSRTPEFAGLAEPGSTVTIVRDQNGYLSAVATVTADANGHFTFTGPTTDGVVEASQQSVNLSLTATDAAGNVSSAATGSYKTDTQAPLFASIDAVGTTSGVGTLTQPRLQGRADPGLLVTLTIDPDHDDSTHNSFALTGTGDAFGYWYLQVPAEHALNVFDTFAATVVVSDAAGNAKTSDVFTYRIEDTTSNPPMLVSPTLINSATPTIRFTARSNWPQSVVVDFDNDPATDNSVTLSNIQETSVGGGAIYSVTIPADHALEDDQTIDVTLQAMFGDPVSYSITADLLAPEAPVSSIPDWFTTTTPTLGGTAEALSRVLVTLDPDGTPATSNSVLFTTTALADGSWSISVPASAGLRNGTPSTVSIVAIDAATNQSAETTDSFSIDLIAPVAPVLYVASTVTSATPTISGLAEPFSPITLVIDPDNDPTTDNSVTLTTTASATGGFSVAYPDSLADGTTASVIATSADQAGNSTSSPISTFTVDLSGGTDSTPDVDHRVPATGGATSDTTPTIFGTGRPNGQVRVFIDSDQDAATDNTLLLTTTVDTDGNWSVTVPDTKAFSDGQTADLVIIQADENGNLIGSAGGDGAIDPRFLNVTYLGGNHRVAALRADSPAIDSGSNPLNLQYDVRGPGFARVNGAAIDIGSYEAQPAVFTVSVDNESDNGDYSEGDLSLREAIKLANLNPGTDTIRFAPGLTTIPISLTDRAK